MANLCFNISKRNRLILRSVLEEITSHVTSSSFSHVQQTPCILRRQYIDGERNAMQCNVIERIFILFYLYIFFIWLVLTSFIILHQQTGKSSYVQNIPTPKYEILHGFLYVSLPSLVAYVLSMGLPIIILQEVNYDNE